MRWSIGDPLRRAARQLASESLSAEGLERVLAHLAGRTRRLPAPVVNRWLRYAVAGLLLGAVGGLVLMAQVADQTRRYRRIRAGLTSFEELRQHGIPAREAAELERVVRAIDGIQQVHLVGWRWNPPVTSPEPETWTDPRLGQSRQELWLDGPRQRDEVIGAFSRAFACDGQQYWATTLSGAEVNDETGRQVVSPRPPMTLDWRGKLNRLHEADGISGVQVRTVMVDSRELVRVVVLALGTARRTRLTLWAEPSSLRPVRWTEETGAFGRWLLESTADLDYPATYADSLFTAKPSPAMKLLRLARNGEIGTAVHTRVLRRPFARPEAPLAPVEYWSWDQSWRCDTPGEEIAQQAYDGSTLYEIRPRARIYVAGLRAVTGAGRPTGLTIAELVGDALGWTGVRRISFGDGRAELVAERPGATRRLTLWHTSARPTRALTEWREGGRWVTERDVRAEYPERIDLSVFALAQPEGFEHVRSAANDSLRGQQPIPASLDRVIARARLDGGWVYVLDAVCTRQGRLHLALLSTRGDGHEAALRLAINDAETTADTALFSRAPVTGQLRAVVGDVPTGFQWLEASVRPPTGESVEVTVSLPSTPRRPSFSGSAMGWDRLALPDVPVVDRVPAWVEELQRDRPVPVVDLVEPGQRPLPAGLERPLHLERRGRTMIAVLGGYALTGGSRRGPTAHLVFAIAPVDAIVSAIFTPAPGRADQGRLRYRLPSPLARELGETWVRLRSCTVPVPAAPRGGSVRVQWATRLRGDSLTVAQALATRRQRLDLPVLEREPEWAAQLRDDMSPDVSAIRLPVDLAALPAELSQLLHVERRGDVALAVLGGYSVPPAKGESGRGARLAVAITGSPQDVMWCWPHDKGFAVSCGKFGDRRYRLPAGMAAELGAQQVRLTLLGGPASAQPVDGRARLEGFLYFVAPMREGLSVDQAWNTRRITVEVPCVEREPAWVAELVRPVGGRGEE